MPEGTPLSNSNSFVETLYRKMILLNRGIAELELYEFGYALDNLIPPEGWDKINPIDRPEIERLIRQKQFFTEIQLKPRKDGKVVLDEKILWLTRTLFKGLVSGAYPVDWVNRTFYFDIRGFIFFVRTNYFPQSVRDHFGGTPVYQFEPTQSCFDSIQEIGYKEFKAANRVIDQAFIDVTKKIVASKDVPLLLTIEGPSAAGKTEIADRLRRKLIEVGKSIATVEMDNFFKDREFRDGKPVDKEVIHFEIFKKSMCDLLEGRMATIPRYDFIKATSSHDLDGNLLPGQIPLTVEPADIILLEGNFPFHIPEIAGLIGVKIVYLTDDPIRLKRKWKRDIDFRKKYDPQYLCNRYFRIQLHRAEEIYIPMMEICDVVVDTTAAALWIEPGLASKLGL
jgi:uridine kinase